ncbi:MAG: glycosyltransferase [Burkholderiaceae bacterium]|jgi:glycosyltransferase involved in cell wall biosynthesis|nr:glycosyltransferase [Burkholderiaceae bacterium]
MSAAAQQTGSAGALAAAQQQPSFWLSVLVPVYNVEDWVAQCLDSIRAALLALPPGQAAGVEVLLLNDASSDASWHIVQQMAAQWPPCGHLALMAHPRNRGLSAARNTLLDAARGEYVWFLDSDDKLMPQAMAALHRHLHAAGASGQKPDLLMCDFQIWRSRPRCKHRLRGELHRSSFAGAATAFSSDRRALMLGLLRRGQMHIWSKITRRALWGSDLRFAEGAYFEDMQLVPRLALHCQSFAYVPQVWVAYRQHGRSILSGMNLRKAQDLSAALLQARDQWQSGGATPPPPGEPEMAFAFSHLAARNFIGAMRYVCNARNGLDARAQQASGAQFWANWQNTALLPAGQLLRQYARRGQLWRAMRFGYWMRRAQKMAAHLKDAAP